jgi:hypothetical protein
MKKYKPKKINLDTLIVNVEKHTPKYRACIQCQDTGWVPVLGGKSYPCPCMARKIGNIHEPKEGE